MCEAPDGFRSSMAVALNDVNKTDFDTTSKPVVWSKMITSLLLLHSVLKARNKYNPVGWSEIYDFDSGDFTCAKSILKAFMDHSDSIQWTALKYITSHVIYGGRVTDEMDQRCLACLTDQFYGEDPFPGRVYIQVDSNLLTLNDLQDFVHRFPEVDDFEICGMHRNASLSLEAARSTELLFSISFLFSLTSDIGEVCTGKRADDRYNRALYTVEELLCHLPARVWVKSDKPSIDPLEIRLIHEAERCNILIKFISSSLTTLLSSVRVMNIEHVLCCLKLFYFMILDEFGSERVFVCLDFGLLIWFGILTY